MLNDRNKIYNVTILCLITGVLKTLIVSVIMIIICLLMAITLRNLMSEILLKGSQRKVNEEQAKAIPWVYNGGSATGGENTIIVPDYALAVSEIFVDGSHQIVGENFSYNAATRVVTFVQPLESEDQVVVMIQSNDVGTLILDMGVI